MDSAPETRLLSTLADVNDALSGARSLRAGLQRALEILTPLYGVLRASVVLPDAETGHLQIEASAGLTAKDRRALPDYLIASELFGYEQGASTDATARKQGVSSWPTRARCFSTKSAT